VWEIEFTDQFGEWWEGVGEEEQDLLDAAVEKLEIYGPALGRPLADTITGSKHPNMKELRPIGSYIRVFFAFDPRRAAILLIGGEKKRGRWKKFYEEMIPVADALYEQHIEQLRREGALE